MNKVCQQRMLWPCLAACIWALCASGCVLPKSFVGEVEADLEQAQSDMGPNRPARKPAVLISAQPFADPVPREAEPAWLGVRISSFHSEAAHAADLLRLAAEAAGVHADLQLSRLPSAQGMHFAGGTAKELMREVAGRLGLFWQAEPERVIFSDTRAKVFDLADFHVDFDNESAPEGNQSISGAGSPTRTAASAASTASSASSRWQNLVRRVQLLAGEGAQVMVSPTPGTLTVRTSLSGMRAVEDYLADLNRQMAKQIELDVRLVQIALSDRRGIGLDWSAVRRSVSVGGERLSDAFAGKGLVVSGEAEGDGDAVVTALFRAFADQGRVRLLTNPRGVTLNGRPIDIALVTQTAYLARVITGAVGLGSVQADAGLEPGIVESGFVLEILPKVQGRQVLLRLRARLSSLQELSEVSSGEQSIQIPTLTESRFSHWARVRSGDTLVLGGVRQLRSDSSFSSAPGRRAFNERTEQVLLITPRIL